MRLIDRVVLHCSDSAFGDRDLIDLWHKQRGWDGVGYHFIILNGFRTKGLYRPEDDGLIEIGRPVHEVGAHVRGHNSRTIGVCLIGERTFSGRQLLVGLPRIQTELVNKYNDLVPGRMVGHYELDDKKTCPNLDMDVVRNFLRGIYKPYPHPLSVEYEPPVR